MLAPADGSGDPVPRTLSDEQVSTYMGTLSSALPDRGRRSHLQSTLPKSEKVDCSSCVRSRRSLTVSKLASTGPHAQRPSHARSFVVHLYGGGDAFGVRDSLVRSAPEAAADADRANPSRTLTLDVATIHPHYVLATP